MEIIENGESTLSLEKVIIVILKMIYLVYSFLSAAALALHGL